MSLQEEEKDTDTQGTKPHDHRGRDGGRGMWPPAQGHLEPPGAGGGRSHPSLEPPGVGKHSPLTPALRISGFWNAVGIHSYCFKPVCGHLFGQPWGSSTMSKVKFCGTVGGMCGAPDSPGRPGPQTSRSGSVLRHLLFCGAFLSPSCWHSSLSRLSRL